MLQRMSRSHAETERRYDTLRNLALEMAQKGLSSEFKLTQITPDALFATKNWEKASGRIYDWEWLPNYNHHRSRYPKRFEVALWENGNLIALSMGRPTYFKSGLRLDVVEGMPKSLGPRSSVTGKVLIAYEVYAGLIGADHVRIMNPVNMDVRLYYERQGYTYNHKGDYLYKGLL